MKEENCHILHQKCWFWKIVTAFTVTVFRNSGCKCFSERLISIFTPLALRGFFFSDLGFLPQPFTNHRTEREGEGISLTPHFHFHPLQRHLDINQAITAECSPLHIVGSRTRTGNLWFPSASRQPPSAVLHEDWKTILFPSYFTHGKYLVSKLICQ